MAVLNADNQLDANILKGLKDAAENGQPMLAMHYVYRVIEMQNEKIKTLEDKTDALQNAYNDLKRQSASKPAAKAKEVEQSDPPAAG